MLHYIEPVIRPPAEADSLILQVTLGCSHNKCAFCVTYKQKRFAVRDEAEILREIEFARQMYPQTTRVFLADGDALAMGVARMTALLGRLYESFPRLRRVSTYATPGNFRDLTLADLQSLKGAGLKILYVGLESGDDKVLERIRKGYSADEMVRLCSKPQDAGLKMSATVILGLGGPRLSMRHAKNTAQLINRIQPRFASALTLMTPLGEDYYASRFGDESWRSLTPEESLIELRTLVSNVDANGIIFRSNHASNYLSLAGTFQKGKHTMLAQIDAALAGEYDLRPEFLRGL